MPKHHIEVGLPAHRVSNADLRVVIKSDGQALGELLISKGTIDWRPARRQRTASMRWETFARLMDDYIDGKLK